MTDTTLTVAATTTNRLTGERPMRSLDRLRYFATCLRENYLPRPAAPPVRRMAMRLPAADEIPGGFNLQSSPSRVICETFWRTLPWDRIAETLGGVRVLEIGCGSGSRLQILDAMLAERLDRYVGIDVRAHDRWPALSRDPRVSFVRARAEDLDPELLADANLIISQSVFEHVERDLEFFQRHMGASVGHPVIQIHLLPATASLFLYLLHGYRQYSPSALGRIAAVYPRSRAAIVPIGGIRSNLLHLLGITVPAVAKTRGLRERRPDTYARLVRACYARERHLHSRVPTFYAFLLEPAEGASLFATERGVAAT